MAQNRQLTGIAVNVVDLRQLKHGMKAHSPLRGATLYRTWPEWAWLRTRQGVFAFNDEGVGPAEPITSTNRLTVELFLPSGMPCSMELDENALAQLPILEIADLASFIKSFGDRYERNLYLWRDFLLQADPPRDAYVRQQFARGC